MDGRRECAEIRDSRKFLDLYSYIYIFYVSNFLIFLLNNVLYTIVYWVKMLLYSLCLNVCNISGSVAMATRNHSTISAYTPSGHIKTAFGIGLRTRPRLISVSSRYIFSVEYISASRIAILFISHCYTRIKTWGESGILSSTILEKIGVLPEFERYAVEYIL